MANYAGTADRRGWSAWRIAGWSIAVILLIIPAVAMQVTTEVDWDLPDFIVMGGLLAAIGLGIEFLVRQSQSAAYRVGAVIALVTAFLTIWVNLAVGMIGDDNPYNLLFAGVLGFGLVGSIVARFAPLGMALTMLVTAVAQAVVGAGGLSTDPRGAAFSMLFAMPWLLAAALFAKAARE